jgi:hypothetical protein
MFTSKQQLAILLALKHGIDNHATLDMLLERFERHDVANHSAVWARERERISGGAPFEDFAEAIAHLFDDQVAKILRIVGSKAGMGYPFSTALEYVQIAAPIVGQNEKNLKEQMAILVALKGSFKAGQPLAETASLIKRMGAGPGLWGLDSRKRGDPCRR